jgi:hypothetical protein
MSYYKRFIDLAEARLGRRPTVDEVAAEMRRSEYISDRSVSGYDRDTIGYELRDRAYMGHSLDDHERFELLRHEELNRGARGN